MAENKLCRNAVFDYPVYGVPWACAVPLLDADGDPVTSALDLDLEIGKNGDTPANAAGTEAEIGNGLYLCTFTAADMECNQAACALKTTTATAKTVLFTLFPRRLPSLATGTTQGGDTTYATLAAGTILFDNQYAGCLLVVVIDGTPQARLILSCTAADQHAVVGDEWDTNNPDADDTYTIYLPVGMRFPTANVLKVENADPTDTIRDSVVDDATRIDASALNTLSGHDPGAMIAKAGDAMTLADNAITAAKIATDAIDADALKADAITEIQAGLALEATLTAIKGAGWATETLVSIKGLVDDLETRLTAARAGYLDNLSAGAVALEATLAAIKGGGWSTETLVALKGLVDDLETRLTAARAGYLDYLDAAISTRAAAGSQMTLADDAITAAKFDESTAFPLKSADTGATQVARTGADSDTLETLSDQIDGVGGGGAPTVGEIADAVFDELLAGHALPGSAGEALAAAGSAGDPWITPLPGAYGEGTAGAIIGGLDGLPAAVVLSAMTLDTPGLVLTLDGAQSGRLPVIQGEALTVSVTITDDAGAAVDCSLATFALGDKKRLADTTFTIEKEHADLMLARRLWGW